MSRSRPHRVFVALSLMLAGVALPGCKSQNAEVTRLNSELSALRDDNAKLQAELDRLRNQPVRDPLNNEFGPDAKVSRRPGEIIVEIAGDVLFDSGSTVLKPTSKQTLDRIASAITDTYSGNHVRVEGYTDTDPIKHTKKLYDSNEELSAMRALAVEKYLVSRGVDPDMIYAAAMGPASQKATKKESRRVEIVILEVTSGDRASAQ
jgi:flagellar motor protein MotB